MQSQISEYIKKSIASKEALLAACLPDIEAAARALIASLQSGGKILFCGNGGSAADAQHIATELLIRYKSANERKALPALSLASDSSALTACGNDYGFEFLFARQVEGLGKSGDTLVGITTSGNSENIRLALEAAKGKKIQTVLLSGKTGGKILARHPQIVDHAVLVPSEETSHIQECHITVGHIFCSLIESALFGFG